jgi:AcrR family transcriptional regulator
MARAFDDKERVIVEKNILDVGTKLFGAGGFEKTSVDEITRRAGVAKGTFYTFWPSKEAFFFACLELAELIFQDEVITPLLSSAAHPADALGIILSETFVRAEEYPIIKKALDPDLIRRLSRKLPSDVLEEHKRIDRSEFAEIVSSWDPETFDPGIAPEVFDGLFKGLLMMSLHRNIIGEDVYDDVTQTMGRVLTAGLKALSDERKE